jgi:phenylacetate-CoA ligase
MQDADFRDSVTADIQRHMGWGGWKLGEPQAVIWGAPFTSSLSRRVRTQLIDLVWNRIQINAFTMTERAMADFADQLRRRKPRILFGYASSVHRFAQFVQDSPYRGLTFDAVFTGAELLLPAVRDYLSETFQCQVFNHYGTNELGGMACECEAHTGLHISTENSYVEILKEGCPARPGEVGDLIITNLNNLGMPFIRYSIGDGGAWYTGDECPCGRELPRLSSIDGHRRMHSRHATGDLYGLDLPALLSAVWRIQPSGSSRSFKNRWTTLSCVWSKWVSYLRTFWRRLPGQCRPPLALESS